MVVTKEVFESLHPLERRIMQILENGNTAKELAEKADMKDVEVMRALHWLSDKNIIAIKTEKKEVLILGKNGKIYVSSGLPEKRFLKVLQDEGKASLQKVQEQAKLDRDELAISLGLLKKKNFISMGAEITMTDTGKNAMEEMEQGTTLLKKIERNECERDALSAKENTLCEDFLKRKSLIETDLIKTHTITLTDLGRKIKTSDFTQELIESLTPSMIKTASWKGKAFRRYDVESQVPNMFPAKRHFVNQATQYVRRIWLEMGFKEMTGPSVATSFWNFDALFTPQDHPAREMQDTFFLADPELGELPKSLVKPVKATHEHGGKVGSKGWRTKWSEMKAKENVLIPHDTYLSAQILSQIKKEDLPVKTFQILKVFRNEAMDWKHLFEFYQVGGIVVDKDLNLRNLLGYLKQFFKKMGYADVRLRPAHFPYTEPSCEVEVFDPRKKEWIELGGAGIFRPEMVEPLMGFDCPVLAWGLGLERVLTNYYKIKDLRTIYKNDMQELREKNMFML